MALWHCMTAFPAAWIVALPASGVDQISQTLSKYLLAVLSNCVGGLLSDLTDLRCGCLPPALAFFGDRHRFVALAARHWRDSNHIAGNQTFDRLLCCLPQDAHLAVNIRTFDRSTAKLGKDPNVSRTYRGKLSSARASSIGAFQCSIKVIIIPLIFCPNSAPSFLSIAVDKPTLHVLPSTLVDKPWGTQ